MLRNISAMKGLQDIHLELIQAEDEGRTIPAELRKKIENLIGKSVEDASACAEADALYDRIQSLPLVQDYPYEEPSDYPSILAQKPQQLVERVHISHTDNLYDKIYGGWIGRCAGCLLGQPVEGWKRERITGLLKESGNWPPRTYISSDLPETIRKKYDVRDEKGAYGAQKRGWINNVNCMPEDDDTNYTVFALRLIEEFGRDFTPEDVAEGWLTWLPLLHTCTAERMTYINLSNLILPPKSAITHNPYREWIGAQIRGDLFGYVNPGNPEAAAGMAFRDASISHIKNGIYGEMWAAAMIAQAFMTDDPLRILEAGLSQIPEKSRLNEKIRQVIREKQDGLSMMAAIDRVHEQYDEGNRHHWCHTISNAMIVAIGLLYGGMDYTESIAQGLIAGFDTDCNAATIGSIVGVAKGANALPASWVDPLHDELISGVDGFGRVKLSELARRTVALAVFD